jgi:hypothetical protein
LGTLGLTIAALAREVAPLQTDPQLLVALADAVDVRYPHTWGT